MQNYAGVRPYLSTAEVAAYLGLKERTLYDLVARREIPCSRVTGKLLFPRALVDRWVESRIEMADARLTDPPPIVGGSSDPLLEWALRESGSGLAILPEGSGAGLARLAEGAAVAVGLHLGHDDTNETSAGMLPLGRVVDLVVLEWARRDQGLVVAKGNPLGLDSLAAAIGSGGRAALRQPGAGGRLLLSRLAEEAGLDLRSVEANGALARTESDVASLVAAGEVDWGLAIGAVARQMGLGFVPLRRERFDIACRRRSYFEPPLQRLFAFARQPAFAAKAAQLGFYDVAGAGRVVLNA